MCSLKASRLMLMLPEGREEGVGEGEGEGEEGVPPRPSLDPASHGSARSASVIASKSSECCIKKALRSWSISVGW